MRSIVWFGVVFVMSAGLVTALRATAASPSCASCGGACVPCCRGTWGEKKSKDPKYEIRCEYACARDRDPWHAPDSECRCHPPCGRVYVKKRLYKSDGEETVERVPTYEVEMVPADPCGCATCRGKHSSSFDLLGLRTLFHRP